jgi:hypothetical protein
MAGDCARQVAIAAAFIAGAVGVGAQGQQPVPAPRSEIHHDLDGVDGVVRRMQEYLSEYARHLPALIATEKYEQLAGLGARRQRRLLESDFGFIQVPNDPQWMGLREVYLVDGKRVTDSATRLAALFASPSAVAVRQARRIAEESARFNIGPIFRTINDPTMVLELLDGRNALRMRFTKDGEATMGGRRVWTVRFQETVRPSIIRTRDLQDLPAQGRAWIDSLTGRVHRAEATIQPEAGGARFTATIDVSFVHDSKMGFAVPAKMTERYLNRNLVVVSSGEATYGNYRRFTVDTNESVDVGTRQ